MVGSVYIPRKGEGVTTIQLPKSNLEGKPLVPSSWLSLPTLPWCHFSDFFFFLYNPSSDSFCELQLFCLSLNIDFQDCFYLAFFLFYVFCGYLVHVYKILVIACSFYVLILTTIPSLSLLIYSLLLDSCIWLCCRHKWKPGIIILLWHVPFPN